MKRCVFLSPMALTAAVLLSLAVGCGRPEGATETPPPVTTGTIPSAAPTIEGTITRLAGYDVLVEVDPMDASRSTDKGMVRLADDTSILNPSGTSVGREQLRVGKKVRVWVDGPVSTSFPWQGTASLIVIE